VVNGCHRLPILIFLCRHIKMLMSLPDFCHCGRTPAAVVSSVMADVILLLQRYVGLLMSPDSPVSI
jgi:hypothetical protein